MKYDWLTVGLWCTLKYVTNCYVFRLNDEIARGRNNYGGNVTAHCKVIGTLYGALCKNGWTGPHDDLDEDSGWPMEPCRDEWRNWTDRRPYVPEKEWSCSKKLNMSGRSVPAIRKHKKHTTSFNECLQLQRSTTSAPVWPPPHSTIDTAVRSSTRRQRRINEYSSTHPKRAVIVLL